MSYLDTKGHLEHLAAKARGVLRLPTSSAKSAERRQEEERREALERARKREEG